MSAADRLRCQRASAAERLRCRLASGADYLRILAINDNIYGGRDYLPALFYKFLSNPRRFLYVGEVDGEIVAFMMIHQVDEGKTILLEAARVAERYINQGVMMRLLGLALIDFEKTNKQAMASLLAGKSPSFMAQPLETRFGSFFDFNMPDIKPDKCLDAKLSNSAEQNQNITRILKQLDAKAILKKTSTKDLFINNIFTVAFEPFELTESNVDMVFAEFCPTVCVTYADVTNSDHQVTAISFCTHVPVRVGIRFDVTFYGSNPKHLTDHVIKHLTVLKTYNVTYDVSFMLTYPTHVDDGNVVDAMKELFEDKKIYFTEKIPLYICYNHSDVVKKNCATAFDKLKSRM